MKRILIYIGVFLMTLTIMPSAQAQKSTELFIPIGKSPGVSGNYTVIGTIDSVDTTEHVVYMQDSTGADYSAKLTEDTKIYLDRSRLKKTNQIGSFEDCRAGAYCEVFYEGRQVSREGVAEWIKIRVEENGRD